MYTKEQIAEKCLEIDKEALIFKSSKEDSFSLTFRGLELVLMAKLYEKTYVFNAKNYSGRDILLLGKAVKTPYYYGKNKITHFDEDLHFFSLMYGEKFRTYLEGFA